MEIRDRVIEMRRVPARDLVPNPKNWRTHPKSQVSALRGMLEEIGNASVLLTREMPDGKLMILDGHLRSDILSKEEVPVVVLDLTEEEADKLLATFDPLTTMANTDKKRLQSILDSFASSNASVLGLLDDIRKAEKLLPHTGSDDGTVQIDKADQLRKKWGTALGQIWRVGEHQIICGDCRNVPIARSTLVLTDPPYNVGKDYGSGTDDAMSTARYVEWTREWFGLAKASAETSVVVTIGITNLPMWLCDIERTHAILAWIKTNQLSPQYIGPGGGFNCWEPVLVYGRAKKAIPQDIFDIPISVQPDTGDHPCPKSLRAWTWLLEHFTDRGDSVCDFFLGSGTTLVAAQQTGRIGYGIEIDPRYVAVTLERLAALGLTPERADTPDFGDGLDDADSR